MPSQSVLAKLSDIPLDVRPGIAEGLWGQLESRFAAREVRRVRGLLECWSGVRPKALRAEQQAPHDLYLPDLEHDDPWLDPGLFAIAADLEASFAALRAEYDDLQRAGTPFRAYGRGLDEPAALEPMPGNPVGWKELALIQEFAPLGENGARAPVASGLAERAIGYHGVVAQFTYLVLEPGAGLPPHTDPANFLVSCHLGIQVPAGCTLTVAGEERAWAEGACLAFNNSFVHEAHNRSSEVRAILSVHALHPALTPVERAAIASLIETFAML